MLLLATVVVVGAVWDTGLALELRVLRSISYSVQGRQEPQDCLYQIGHVEE